MIGPLRLIGAIVSESHPLTLKQSYYSYCSYCTYVLFKNSRKAHLTFHLSPFTFHLKKVLLTA